MQGRQAQGGEARAEMAEAGNSVAGMLRNGANDWMESQEMCG
jgi:hypothetical protein